jgi:death-on-curing protein
VTGEPEWIARQVLILLHAEALAEHGGREGIRDESLLDSALARPRNLLAYGKGPDLARLAAAYAVAVARNHPFADGNKRAAFLSVGLFLGLNGYRLTADKVEATRVMLSVASGEFPEEGFADWIRRHMEPRTR